MTTAPRGHRAVPKTWTSIKVLPAPPRSHKPPTATTNNLNNKRHKHPVNAHVQAVRNPKRLQVRSSIKKTNATLKNKTVPAKRYPVGNKGKKHSPHSPNANNQMQKAAKFDKRARSFAVARLDGTSKPRDVQVNIPDSVAVSPSCAKAIKKTTIGAKEVAEVKRAQPRVIPNARRAQVGSSTGVSASQTDVHGDARAVTGGKNDDKAVDERRMLGGNDVDQFCESESELTPEQEKMARENERRLQQEIEYLEEISRKSVSEEWKKWSKWYAEHVRTADVNEKRNGEQCKQQCGSSSGAPASKADSKGDSVRATASRDACKAVEESAVVDRSDVVNQSNACSDLTREQKATNPDNGRHEKQDMKRLEKMSTKCVSNEGVSCKKSFEQSVNTPPDSSSHRRPKEAPASVSYGTCTSPCSETSIPVHQRNEEHEVAGLRATTDETNGENTLTQRDSELTPQQERNARLNELSLELETAYLESISRKQLFASKYIWARTYPGRSIHEVNGAAREPHFFQKRFNCGPCGSEAWPETFDQPVESTECDMAMDEVCNDAERQLAGVFRKPYDCGRNGPAAWRPPTRNEAVKQASQGVEAHLEFLFQSRFHSGPSGRATWPARVSEEVMIDV